MIIKIPYVSYVRHDYEIDNKSKRWSWSITIAAQVDAGEGQVSSDM